MPKSKSRTYTSTAEAAITVVVPGHSTVTLEPGESFSTEDPAVVAALDGNPDLEAGKAKKAGGK